MNTSTCWAHQGLQVNTRTSQLKLWRPSLPAGVLPKPFFSSTLHSMPTKIWPLMCTQVAVTHLDKRKCCHSHTKLQPPMCTQVAATHTHTHTQLQPLMCTQAAATHRLAPAGTSTHVYTNSASALNTFLKGRLPLPREQSRGPRGCGEVQRPCSGTRNSPAADAAHMAQSAGVRGMD